tara:strand:- start:176 stop:499 length:324 start_codon:yes stop_codon:yes gene_type:complete
MNRQEEGWKNKLLQLRKTMYEVIMSRDDLIDKLVTHEKYDAYPLSDREEEQGSLDSYLGMPLEDEKQDLLKEISVITTFIEYQKEMIAHYELLVEHIEKTDEEVSDD